MFVEYSKDEIRELLAAGNKDKRPPPEDGSELAPAAKKQNRAVSQAISTIKLFENIPSDKALTLVAKDAFNVYPEGTALDVANANGRIFYIMDGVVALELADGQKMELSKDNIFGEVDAFLNNKPTYSALVDKEATIFSFKINPDAEPSAYLAMFYRQLCALMAEKTSWFGMC